MIERRSSTRRTKTVAFIGVTVVFVAVKALGDYYPFVDHLSHLAIVSYLGARIFLRGI